MSILVKNNIHWVGQRDWEVRDFHGTEYKTLRGSSYNSYLIREEKNVLIDTVDHKFSREFVQNLRSEIDLADIDYIIINHAEEDHAGALTELMAQIPDTPIYCTANAIDSINGHHHHPEWNFKVVKTGDTLDIGDGKQLIFVETPMLHWPDSMMTYMTGDAVLFSNDAFGQHYCDEHLFNDEVDQTELFEQCQRYYANILTPFSRLVTPKITEILGFNLPVDRLSTRLQDAGFEMSLSLKAKWRPDLDALELCRQHGRDIARQWALAPLPETTQKTAPVEETTTCTAADLGPKMQCSVCQWIYDPALGEPLQDVAPGTPWSDVPDNFLCPECSLGKDVFDVLATEAK